MSSRNRRTLFLVLLGALFVFKTFELGYDLGALSRCQDDTCGEQRDQALKIAQEAQAGWLKCVDDYAALAVEKFR